MTESKKTNKRQLIETRLPSQIPLLEDIISDAGSAPVKSPVKKMKVPELDPLDKPIATDLFGDPIHSYAVKPDESKHIDEERLHSQATLVVNSLVKEYSHEIVRRLRNELTSVLNDLAEPQPASTRQHQASDPPEDREIEQKPSPGADTPSEN